MKITGKRSLGSFIELCLKLVMVIGIIIIIGLPYFLQKYSELMHPQMQYYPSLIILYLSRNSSINCSVSIYKNVSYLRRK